MWLRRKEMDRKMDRNTRNQRGNVPKKAAMTESGIYVQITKSCIDHAHVQTASFHQEALYQLNNRINPPVNGAS